MPDLAPDEKQPTGSAPIAVRAQILSTEHWSLLATRSLAWSESFSRASWFVTVVSATMVALALVADRTDFGVGFRLFALVLVPLAGLIGDSFDVGIGVIVVIGVVVGLAALTTLVLLVVRHVDHTWDRRRRNDP